MRGRRQAGHWGMGERQTGNWKRVEVIGVGEAGWPLVEEGVGEAGHFGSGRQAGSWRMGR